MIMKKNSLFIILFLYNFVFTQNLSDSTEVIYADSKAPLIISTLPYVTQDPTAVAAFATLLIAASQSDSLQVKMDDPNTAMFLSSIPLFSAALSSNEMLLLPSLGQVYNKKIFKSFIMSAMKSYWLIEYKRSKDSDIKDRNRSLWWLLALTLYSIADAYVDAQFAQNDQNKNNNDNGDDK